MANSSVRNNSPDPTGYHENVGGMPGTMIPRSGNGGQSLAFDANKPQVVIVDPGEIDGGFTLDMSQLLSSKDTFNIAAMRSEAMADPSAFFKELSVAAKEKTKLKDELTTKLENKLKEPPTMTTEHYSKPIQPLAEFPSVSEYPKELQDVPAYESLNEESLASLAAEFDMEGEIQQLLQEEAVKAQDQHKQFELNRKRQVTMENEQNSRLQQHIKAQDKVLNSLVAAVNSLIEKKMEPPAEREPPPRPRHPEISEDKAAPEIDLIEGIGSLHIEFLADGKPQPPKYETYFEMSKMGTMSARYHAVIKGKDCIALVYDTRFENGFQYLPPNLGDELITLSVPKLDNAVYTCSSLGLQWAIGCLDVVILINHEQGA